MAASSVELFACRVQLIGLQQSATSITSANFTNKFENNTRPSIDKVRRISRNLFGTPDPVEMKTIYQREAERSRLYVSHRYNFDTEILKEVNEDNDRRQKPTNSSNGKQALPYCKKPSIAIPTLIEQELKNHEQRLLNEEHKLNFANFEMTPSNEEEIYDPEKGSNISHRCCELQTSAVRLKPYTRQSLITDSFNVCKIRNKPLKSCNGHTKEMTHRKVRLTESSLNCQHKGIDTKNKVHSEVSDQKSEESDKNTCRKNVGNKINCTTLSLQVVLSTKNAS